MLYSVMCTVYIVHISVYSVKCTVYSVQCTVYSVKCTVCSVQCAVYSVQSSKILKWKLNHVNWIEEYRTRLLTNMIKKLQLIYLLIKENSWMPPNEECPVYKD